ncbi:MAG: alanine racemase [Clostridia bacterium]|nr:alanine racemase [Clostridia bacterium]
MNNRYYRTYAQIDLGAITENFDALRALLPQNVKVLSIVKADAYGHGAVAVAHQLQSRTDFFAVSAVDEGVELRQAGIQKPILILSYTDPREYDMLLSHDIRATLYNLDEAKLLSERALELGKRATVHIAVDTGMGRIGFPVCEEAADCVREICALPGLQVEGIFSHYATADCADKSEAHKQTARFDAFLAMLERRGVRIPIRHICNSAGAMEFDRPYDMVRLGIALYGLYPSDEVDQKKVKLRPAMQVFSHVIHVKTVESGTAIGYGRAYLTPERRKIATVSIGYADGFNRAFTGCGSVLVGGIEAPVVGKVCMDQIMVDVTGAGDVKPGDRVVILGTDGAHTLSADEIGAKIGSFGYEVICNFMPRVHRVYVNGTQKF